MWWFLLFFLCLPVWVNADVYQWRDASGGRHFSDQFRAEATALPLPLLTKPTGTFYKVAKVYDGDTVLLADGRKIRLLGINTPEVSHFGKATEAGGELAKRWLADALAGRKVRLELGVEKTDKYGRTLAHLFTDTKEHVNLQLVKSGLATVSIYPPNLGYAAALVAAEQEAERGRLGIWGLPQYAPVAVDRLSSAGHQGWTRVTGKVVAVRHTKRVVYLEFSNLFTAHIGRRWLDLFPELDSYRGKTVEVRGWLSHSQQHLSMLLRHPSAVKLLP